MKPFTAWSTLALAAALAWATLAGPAWAVIAILAVGFSTLRRARVSLLAFTAVAVVINGILMAWFEPGPERIYGLGIEGARLGVLGALRLSALIVANSALLQWVHIPVLLDGLRLPARTTGLLAAVLVASRDVGRDLNRIRDARRLDGSWPTGRFKQLSATGDLLPTLFLASWHRALHRQDALRGAGIVVGPHFAPIVTVAALAVAGRLAFLALPNIALTYAVVFLGGLVFGARVGFWAGMLAMGLTNLMLSGLAPAPFVNAPAMGLLGLLGGLMRPALEIHDAGTRILAAAIGILGTLLFSAFTDVATWALIPEYRTSTDLLAFRVLGGLAFNVLPAISNGILFAISVGPMGRAAAAWRATQPQAMPKELALPR